MTNNDEFEEGSTPIGIDRPLAGSSFAAALIFPI